MVLGSSQYIIREEDNTEYIVMVHHPLHWFRDAHQCNIYLKRARVILTGHEHHLVIQKTVDESGNESLEIGAGAVNAPENDHLYQFRYNWMKFEINLKNDNVVLSVTVYPRVWERTRFIPDQGRLNGRTFAVFDLKCPNLVAPLSPKTDDYELVPLITPFREGGSEFCDMVEQGCAMEDDTRQNFARLRYHFWRLEWPDRLRILVRLDVLPSTISQPVPQVLERLALDRAMSLGKLHDLWTAVMEMIPEEKREPNPF
jgi:hypothetical protein